MEKLALGSTQGSVCTSCYHNFLINNEMDTSISLLSHALGSRGLMFKVDLTSEGCKWIKASAKCNVIIIIIIIDSQVRYEVN